MAKTSKILRKSIFTFLKNYQYLTSTPSLLAFPFAISILLSQSLISSSNHFPLIQNRLSALFLVAGLAPSSKLFEFFNYKLSQTILTFVFSFPFTLSFLILSKSSVIRSLEYNKFDYTVLLNPLFITQLYNSVVFISASATCFFMFVLFFNCVDFLGISSTVITTMMSAIGALIYSIAIANAYVICNLALILSGIEKRGGFISILKAYVLIRGRTVTALTLSLSINLGLSAIESLFQYRIVRDYNLGVDLNLYMVLEGMFIAYLYGALIVLDTIVGYEFLKSCKTENRIVRVDIEEEIFQEVKLLGLVP